MAENISLSQSGKYGITPNGDVYEVATGRHIDLPEFQSLGLNSKFLPQIPEPEAIPKEWQALYNQLDTMLGNLAKQGQVINPNVQITPDKLAEFANQAKTQLDPYYANQLKVAKDQFLSSLGYSKEQIQNQEKQYEQQYKEGLRTIGEQAADTGFALSGKRNEAERQLAENTQNTLDQNRRQLQFNAGNTASQFAQTYGLGALPASPMLTQAPRVLPGQSSFSYGEQSPFYSLSNDVYQGLIGSKQNEQKQAEGSLARTLSSDYTTGLANTQLRNLTL